MKIAKSIEFPPGFGLELGGASRDQQEVFSEMGIALIMGIAVMYLVLVMQFGSFTAPIPVMLSLPLSLIGVVLALLVTKGTINLMSLIGVIMLMGLVAKNAILLLDAARREEDQGVDREEALMHAGRARLRPILMTTFALIAGMLPVAIGMGEGGGFYRPMAVAIIGGTITSTVLTLLVVPSFYDSVMLNRDRSILKWKARALLWNPLLAFIVTFILESIATLLLFRFLFRCVLWLMGKNAPQEHPVEIAAREHGLAVPEHWVARPKAWQRRDGGSAASRANPYGSRPSSDVATRLPSADHPIG
jgi:HAE1 family hydrophobic/amphiphilic exporter-1